MIKLTGLTVEQQEALECTVLSSGMIVPSRVMAKMEIGYTGNGCGSGWASRVLAWLMQVIWHVDISLCCRYHDGGYDEQWLYKSAAHKLLLDATMHYNVTVVLKDKSHRTRHFVGAVVHMVLLWKGTKAYTANSPNREE